MSCGLFDIFFFFDFNIQEVFDILNYIVSNNLRFPNFPFALKKPFISPVSVISSRHSLLLLSHGEVSIVLV